MTATPVVPALPVPSFVRANAEPEEIGPPKSFLLYGDTGTKKTLAIAKLFKAGFFKKILFLDIDDGAEVLAGDPIIREALKDGRITRIQIDPFDPNAKAQIEAMILEVAGMWRDPNGDILTNPSIPDFGYDLVFIDTMNLVHEVAIKSLLRTTYNDKGTALDGRAAYGKLGEWDDEMVRLIHRSKRFTGGFVMHAKEVEEKSGATKIKPKLSGSFQNTISTIPSITAYLDYQKDPTSGETVLVATVGESDLYDSKNRYNLGTKIYDFDIAETYRQIYDQIGLPQPVPATTSTPVAPATK